MNAAARLASSSCANGPILPADVATPPSPWRRGGSAREPAAHRVPSPEVVGSGARTVIIRGDLRAGRPTFPALGVEGA